MRTDKALIPSPHENLPDLPPIERSAEVLKYSFLTLEHSISPGGLLRMILKKTGFFIIIALAVLPLALLVGLLAEILVQIVSSLLLVVFGLFLLYLFALTAKNGRRG